MRLLAYLFLLLAQSNTYFGPKSPSKLPLVQVEVLVQDSTELGGVRVISASFNQTDIPLKPPDINGFRGSGSFQVLPGKYLLTWVIQRDKIEWPRKIDHETEVIISPKDSWVQIYITGEEASIR